MQKPLFLTSSVPGFEGQCSNPRAFLDEQSAHIFIFALVSRVSPHVAEKHFQTWQSPNRRGSCLLGAPARWDGQLRRRRLCQGILPAEQRQLRALPELQFDVWWCRGCKPGLLSVPLRARGSGSLGSVDHLFWRCENGKTKTPSV